MQVIYRVCPFLSQTAVKWTDSKFEIFRKSLFSFIQAGVNTQDITFIADRCTQDYVNLIKSNAPDSKIEAVAFNVKRDSILYSFDYARKLNDDLMIIEDDYLWRKNKRAYQIIKDALTRFDAVTPYDHPDHYDYLDKSHHIEKFNNRLWRNCHTTTHTFAVKKEVFQNNIDDFYFGQHDWIMWTKLMNNGVNLFSPVCSLATHLADGHLAIGTDWKKRFDEL